MSLETFIERNYLRVYKYFIAGARHKYFYKGTYPKSQKIVFYLCDREAVHLGDSLWFEPVIRFLSKYYNVAVCPNSLIRFYFVNLGYNVVNADQIGDDCLLITIRELMYKLRKYKNVLYLNLDYKLLAANEKLIDSVVKSVAKFFNLPASHVDSKYQKLVYTDNERNCIATKFELNKSSRYIIFNNYIDSWGKSTTIEMLRTHQLKLIDYARDFLVKNHNVQFLYVGSNHDLCDNQLMEDESSFIDLRGRTEVNDLFILGSMPQVIGYMGFDTFLLHLSNMYDKESYILLKPGHTDKLNRLIINHVLVPYTNNNQVSVNLL